MKLYSTNNKNLSVTLKTAIFKGLPEDNGLYMPSEIPNLSTGFLQNISKYSFQEIAFEVSKNLLKGTIPDKDLEEIIHNSITFPAPVVKLSDHLFIQELFHGPSLAFKDFGARFMAQLMSYFNKEEDKDLVILVATSGDTGGAVASGFYKTPGIKVVILYPSKKVSPLQEKQLTTLGENITALEVNGTFDDCQSLVKKAFLDEELRSKVRISSANSINIARLIPQSFYYFEGFKQVRAHNNAPISFSIPSGNFGNLTAGVISKKMGLPVKYFLAATNINKVVPEYLKTGIYQPKESKRTISNAMDVGNPSNFKRLMDIYCSTWNKIKEDLIGYSFTDGKTKEAILSVFKTHNYIIDPHGAIGYLGAANYQKQQPFENLVILETAHFSKFLETMEELIPASRLTIPERLQSLAGKEKKSTIIKVDYKNLKDLLIDNYH